MIREAAAADCGAIQGLYEILCPGEPIGVLAGRIEQIRQDQNSLLLVVEEHGTVQATAFLTICLDPMLGQRPYAVLENIVVAPGRRGQGLGTALMEHVELVCRERNCSKMMLLSSSRRTGAHRFFSRLGYSDTVSKGFKKYLGEGPPAGPAAER